MFDFEEALKLVAKQTILCVGDLMLDDFVNKLDPETRAAGEKAAKPWFDALKKPKG